MNSFTPDVFSDARSSRSVTSVLLLLFLCNFSLAQDRLKGMPGYERFDRMNRETKEAIPQGAVSVVWTNEGRALDYAFKGKRYRYDVQRRVREVLPEKKSETNAVPARHGQRPERGRQYAFAMSPDGKWKASCRDRNLWMSETNDANPMAITTEGNKERRLKFGTANWVYGEELDQDTAIWWSSNSQKVAFYKFDESQVLDYHLALDQTKIQSKLDVEPYMKTGTTNPTVGILIYDLPTKKIVEVDVRDGKPFDDAVVGHYVYRVSWTADSSELLFHRMNRLQKVLELCAANPETGACRVIVREEWPESWVEQSPEFRFLKDGRRFVWASERSGWRNLYLYSLEGQLLSQLTSHEIEVDRVVHVDEEEGRLFYTARTGDNPMKSQLHKVGLDGKGDQRLTDPAFHHTINLSPDGEHFIDVAQTHNQPPSTTLRTADGQAVAEIAKSDMARFKQLDLRTVELLKFKAADGQTDLYGMLHFPSNFKSRKKYPLLVSVYAGPGTVGARETFTMPHPLTEFGFLVASFDSRSASGRGKRFLDAIYRKLGTVEVDDQAAAVQALAARRYIDSKRVGIFGASYGGTVSAAALLRYPGVFQAACANSAVTDFRNYDTIYTERYMALPQDNKDGYENARVMNYVSQLRGSLMLFYGTADNNVHPSNTLQLIEALQKAGKSFEVQVGPDQGHASLNRDRMMEFFIERLVLD